MRSSNSKLKKHPTNVAKKGYNKSIRLTTSPGFDLTWLGLGCSLTDSGRTYASNLIPICVGQACPEAQ